MTLVATIKCIGLRHKTYSKKITTCILYQAYTWMFLNRINVNVNDNVIDIEN